MTSPYKLIEAVLTDYFDGLYHCDTERLGRVFHPGAIYATADEHPFLRRDMADYFEVIRQREPPSDRRDPRDEHVDSIEFAGSTVAFARVRCSFGGRDFTDFLTFVFTEDRWQIIAKVFHFTERKI